MKEGSAEEGDQLGRTVLEPQSRGFGCLINRLSVAYVTRPHHSVGWDMKHSFFDTRDGQDSALIDEAERLRDRLHYLLNRLDGRRDDHAIETSGAPDVTAQRVRAILKGRRQRDWFFEDGLFADPAWDILLELYEAELGGYRMSVSSLCIGAAVPATTALRWIKHLGQKELVSRALDPADGRRVFVSLSHKASTAMSEFMRCTLPSEPTL